MKKFVVLLLICVNVFLLGCSNGFNGSEFSAIVKEIRDAESFTLTGDKSTYYYDGLSVFLETESEKYFYDISNDKLYVFNNDNWYLDNYKIKEVINLKKVLVDSSNSDFSVSEIGGFLNVNEMASSVVIYNDNSEKDLSVYLNPIYDDYSVTNINETTFEHPDLENALVNEALSIWPQAFFSDVERDFFTYESIDWRYLVYPHATFSAYDGDIQMDFDFVNPTFDYDMEAGIQTVTCSYFGLSYDFEFFFYDPDEPIVLAQYTTGSDYHTFIGYCYVSELDTCEITYENELYHVASWYINKEITEEENGNGYEGDYKEITGNALIYANVEANDISDVIENYELSDLNYIRVYQNSGAKHFFISETEIYNVSNQGGYIYTDLTNNKSYIQYDYNSMEGWVELFADGFHNRMEEDQYIENQNSTLIELEEVLDLIKTLNFTSNIYSQGSFFTTQYQTDLNSADNNGIESILIVFNPEEHLIHIEVRKVESQYSIFYINYEGVPFSEDLDYLYSSELLKPDID